MTPSLPFSLALNGSWLFPRLWTETDRVQPDVSGMQIVEKTEVSSDSNEEDENMEDQAGNQFRLVTGIMFDWIIDISSFLPSTR